MAKWGRAVNRPALRANAELSLDEGPWRSGNVGHTTPLALKDYECDLPVWPQCCRLNCSDPPRGIVSVFQFFPAWMRAT